MSLLRRNRNGGLIPSLQSELSELFDTDNFFRRPLWESSLWDGKGLTKVPAANIHETDNEFVIELAAPGMNKKDFEVDIDNNVLEIKVEKEERSKEDKPQYTRREYDYTAFYRAFNLPETVQSEKIKAEYKDGLLKIVLPKVAEAKKKPVKEIAVV